ncbi:YHS domain-containing protein [Aromatoleum evansii]|uniref:YHS domain-containing protein n=1 Tax=Aromatoleum evansii TaxID=59406 RepID=UPI00145D65BC|nr:YHS domain-containing protein [Aromatoleum evansii]
MEWLSQNWIWVLLLVGVFAMMSRGGMGCGGGRRSYGHGRSEEHGAHSPTAGDQGPRAESAIDPVSGRPVQVLHAVTCVYKGRTYYFATRENRESFEASPERFAVTAPSGDTSPEHRHHRRGC